MEKQSESAVILLAKALEQIFPGWLTHTEITSLVKHHLGQGFKCRPLVENAQKVGVYLEKKYDVQGNPFYRLSGLDEPYTGYLSLAKRRIKTNPIDAFLSLDYSELYSLFNQ